MEKQKLDDEKDIKERLKKPFDYGSEEYLEIIEKIKANREKYRNEQRTKEILKYKMIKGIYEK